MWTTVNILPRHAIATDSYEVSVQPKSGRIHFIEGQFIVLEIELPGGLRRSAFSIVRAEGKGVILAIKRKGDDGISARLQHLEGPIRASMAGPFGQFSLNQEREKHIFIAGGSGITPVRCMLDALLLKGRDTTLIYTNASPEEAMYLKAFRALAEEGHLRLIEVYGRKIRNAMEPVEMGGAAIYLCGPPGMMATALEVLDEKGIPDEDIRTEQYGLNMGSNAELPEAFHWRSVWGGVNTISSRSGETMLQGANRTGVRISHACEVGVCGTCRARVIKGQVMCGQEVRGPGEEILTCISQPHGADMPTIGPVRGGRAQLVAMGLMLAALLVGIWSYPPAVGFKAWGPMNTSHGDLECNACHKQASGTFRQQVGHNARSLFGFHAADMVPVGMAPVGNAACLECHDRPNDRHPTSRFMETRFADQRETLGPHECNNCHGEHRNQRVSLVEPGFCIHCHQDTEVNYDRVEPSHAELFEDGAWETCLQCHDFHGNHLREAPRRLADGIPTATILDYLAGGPDPYGPEKTWKAEKQ